MKTQWSREDQLILDVLSNELFDAQNNLQLEQVDWDALLEESIQQTVSALIYDELSKDKKQIPSEIYERWMSLGFQMVTQNLRVEQQHNDLAKLLDDNNISYCILKGCASAHYYPKPYLRTMGDVDFIVENESIDKTTRLLVEQGYIRSKSDHPFHIDFKKNKNVLEMHFQISKLPEGAAGDIIRGWMSDIIETAETITSENGGSYKIPSWFHHGIVILVHMQRHMMREGIGLRHLCDWAVYINRLDNEQLNIMKDRLQTVGLWRFAQIMSQTVIVYLGASHNDVFGKIEADLCSCIMDDILSSGNFGRKDANHSMSSFVIFDNKKMNNDHSQFWQALISLNRIVYTNWPVAKKIKILLPVGYVYFTCRYLIRIILGKRKKFKIKKVLSEGHKRKVLYDQLHVYKIEK